MNSFCKGVFKRFYFSKEISKSSIIQYVASFPPLHKPRLDSTSVPEKHHIIGYFQYDSDIVNRNASHH